MSSNDPVAEIVPHFRTLGSYLESCPYGNGHINDTYVAVFGQSGTRVRYILQRINQQVFRQPTELMENVVRVTEEAHRKLAEMRSPDASRRALRVVPSCEGQPFVLDGKGNHWRCYPFIEGARTYDIVESERLAYEAARAFGEFQNLISGLAGPRLHETIPHFHHTRKRFDRLCQVVEANPRGRLNSVQPEWGFIRQREELVDTLLNLQAGGELPERVTHNDTKLNNVLIDEATQVGICVVDLDTVMPGLALYDFGDLVRTATSPAAEDEVDLTKVRMQMPMFEALVRGYLSRAGGVLNEAEKAHLAFSGKLIALEIGIRFLTDYLEGDHYFKTSRKRQNLDRCRTQLALVQSIEEQEDAMRRVVDSVKLP